MDIKRCHGFKPVVPSVVYNAYVPKSLRDTLIEWRVRDRAFLICGSIMVLAGLADLLFRTSENEYRSGWYVLLGVFLLCVGIYNLTKLSNPKQP
jgi:hypothetical protein